MICTEGNKMTYNKKNQMEFYKKNKKKINAKRKVYNRERYAKMAKLSKLAIQAGLKIN